MNELILISVDNINAADLGTHITDLLKTCARKKWNVRNIQAKGYGYGTQFAIKIKLAVEHAFQGENCELCGRLYYRGDK